MLLINGRVVDPGVYNPLTATVGVRLNRFYSSVVTVQEHSGVNGLLIIILKQPTWVKNFILSISIFYFWREEKLFIVSPYQVLYDNKISGIFFTFCEVLLSKANFLRQVETKNQAH